MLLGRHFARPFIYDWNCWQSYLVVSTGTARWHAVGRCVYWLLLRSQDLVSQIARRYHGLLLVLIKKSSTTDIPEQMLSRYQTLPSTSILLHGICWKVIWVGVSMGSVGGIVWQMSLCVGDCKASESVWVVLYDKQVDVDGRCLKWVIWVVLYSKWVNAGGTVWQVSQCGWYCISSDPVWVVLYGSESCG